MQRALRSTRRQCLRTALIGAALVCGHSPAIAHPAESPRLPRTNPLVYRNRRSEVRAVKLRSDWKKHRAKILHGVASDMGPLPGREKRVALQIEVTDEVDCGCSSIGRTDRSR